MHLNLRRVTSLSKNRGTHFCRLCLERKGVIRQLKICRKCFYDHVDQTTYRCP